MYPVYTKVSVICSIVNTKTCTTSSQVKID